jgi:hypothetical protein
VRVLRGSYLSAVSFALTVSASEPPWANRTARYPSIFTAAGLPLSASASSCALRSMSEGVAVNGGGVSASSHRSAVE